MSVVLQLWGRVGIPYRNIIFWTEGEGKHYCKVCIKSARFHFFILISIIFQICIPCADNTRRSVRIYSDSVKNITTLKLLRVYMISNILTLQSLQILNKSRTPNILFENYNFQNLYFFGKYQTKWSLSAKLEQ